MRNKIFGGIGFVWGALILLRFFLYPPQGVGSYQAGQYMGVAIGVVMLFTGLYYLVKKSETGKKP